MVRGAGARSPASPWLSFLKAVNDPQANALVISEVEQGFLGMGFPEPSSALTNSPFDNESSASGDAKAFVRKALTDLNKHSQKIALAQQQLCDYEARLCQEIKTFRMPKDQPIVPSTDTFTGGGRQPTLETNRPRASTESFTGGGRRPKLGTNRPRASYDSGTGGGRRPKLGTNRLRSSTDTVTGGGRQPTLGTNTPRRPFVSEGFDSYVLVSSPTGLEFCVPFVKTTTTEDFKYLVADIAAMDVDGLVLFFGRNILAEDDLTMEDYGVESGATLGLVIDKPEMKLAAGDGLQKEA